MQVAPSGTLTFLFTDIEGSTGLWEEDPQAMAGALKRHDALLGRIVEAHQGRVFATGGDSFSVVFPNPVEAVRAALDGQLALQEDRLRVRMALHTGVAEERGGNYFGPALNRTARLAGAAHGGQVLVSLATEALVREALPGGVSLRDLGQHRLPDLAHPEHVFQLVHPELRRDFPPLRSLEAHPHNLPVQLTSFVGREEELSEVEKLLGENRLLTLSGVGGTGKTRLALQAAAEALEGYRDGVWLVELGPIGDPAMVPQAVASALGLQEQSGQPITELLTEHLRPKDLLLILDNCEHLVEAAARLADGLLRSCPELRVLATSREALGISGELPYQVPSLRVPRPEDELEALSESEAVRLFRDRAGLARPGFSLSRDNGAAVAEICRRLDGIPLALELAAARVKALSPDQIASRLGDSFRLLTGGSRTAMPRQQTLEATMAWSYDLLSDAERALLRRLSVFVGGFTVEAAEAVCADDEFEGSEALDLLLHLVDKSLVVPDEGEQEVRYRLLETVRQYARRRLQEAGEAERIRTQHAEFYLAMAREGDGELRGPRQPEWMARLETEHDNLRSALEWSLAAGSTERAAGLAASLAWFWWLRGHWTEGRRWIDRTLELGEEWPEGLQVRTLVAGSRLSGTQGDADRAEALAEEAVELARGTGDEEGLAWSLCMLGEVTWGWKPDLKRSIPLLEESLARFRKIGDLWAIGHVLGQLGDALMASGDFARGMSLQEEALEILRTSGDLMGVSERLRMLGVSLRRKGDYQQAAALLEESLALFRRLGDRNLAAHVLVSLGAMAADEGKLGEAEEFLEESLATLREIGDKGCSAQALGLLASVLHRQGDPERARQLLRESLTTTKDREVIAGALEFLAQVLAPERPDQAISLLGAAEKIREEIGAPRAVPEQADHERVLSSLRRGISEQGFREAWEGGWGLSSEEAISRALALTSQE
jgi:predicted ATPase/class 3 adenylate cyclase